MSRKSPKKYKIYKYNYTCNRLPKNNLLKKSSEIDFSSGDILTSKKSRCQRILNRVRGKKKREISPSYFITPCFKQRTRELGPTLLARLGRMTSIRAKWRFYEIK